jgi:hypothetical protein
VPVGELRFRIAAAQATTESPPMHCSLRSTSKEANMNLNLSIGPLISLIAGILILVMPKLLNYIVALYLIIIGLLGLFGTGNLHFR